MGVPSALTNTQKTNLRAERYQSRTFLALNPNATVATARINQTTFANSIAELTFDGGSGTANVLVGQTVLISRTNDMRSAFFRGRVRKAISGATLYINENSQAFADNDYIFILNDVALHTKLPRNDNGTFYMDYDVAFRQLVPVIYGLQSAYVVTLNSTPLVDLALTPSAIAPTNGASISSWAWVAPSATFQAGSSSTQNVTLRWTTAGVYWVRLTVTDSGGRTNFMTFPVFVCSADYSDSFIQTGVEQIAINANETGYQLSVNAFDGVSSVLDQTLAVVFSLEKANGNSTPIVSNVNFVGRLRNNTVATEADGLYVNVQDTAITIEDIGAQMARTPLLTYTFFDVSSPATWGDVASLTIWRALYLISTEMSTLSNVCSIQFDSTSTDFRTYDINQNDNVLIDGLNNIADAINSRVTFTGQGQIYFYRSARFLSTSARTALATVMDFTLADMQSFNIMTDPAKLIGRQITYGGAYNTTSQDVDLFEAIAPAVAPAEGVGQNETANQVLTANQSISDAQDEIGGRVANDFEQRNPITKLDAVLHDGFHFIVPCNFQWYTFTITASDNNRGLAYTTANRWLCESLSMRYDNAIGTWEVTASFAIETVGGNYQTVENIAPQEEGFYTAPYPVLDAYPSFPDDNPYYPDDNPPEDETPAIKPKDTQPIKDPVTDPLKTEISAGGVVFVWDSAGVYRSTNFTSSDNPTWTQVYSGNGITDFKVMPQGNGGYVLQNDGVDSTFKYSTDILSASYPTWNAVAITGVYEAIRTTDTAGEVYIGFGAGCDDSIVFSTLPTLPATVTLEEKLSTIAPWTAFTFVPNTNPTPNTIAVDSGIRMVWDVVCDGDITLEWGKLVGNTGSAEIETWDGMAWTSRANSGGIIGGGVMPDLIWANVTNISFSKIRATCLTRPYLISLTTGSGTSGTSTRYSTDNGATFASEVSAGVPPAGDNGFDTQRIGDLVFVGVDTKTVQATNGGAYSDTTNGGTAGTYPKLIRTYGQSGTKLILGSAVAIASDTLWKINAGITAITPNDGVNDGIAVSPNCLDMWITSDDVIIGLFSFGGTVKLARSTNGGSSWSFVTTNITSASTYLRVRQSDTLRRQVYSVQADRTLYSNDGGATMQVKSSPSASLLGIEVKS